MSINTITVPQYTCDVCMWVWVSRAKRLPAMCPNRKCRTREWNGQKHPSHAHEIKFPAPRKPGRPKTITEFADEAP